MTIAHADVATPEALVDAAYRLISGRADEPRDWDSYRALCAPGARLMPVSVVRGTATIELFDADGYVRSRTPILAAADFYERDAGRRIDRFGNFAHVWSAYEARRSMDAEPFLRGVNSFQLLHSDDRWWIVSVLWQSATS